MAKERGFFEGEMKFFSSNSVKKTSLPQGVEREKKKINEIFVCTFF
jgi:hypothetical protein